MKYKINDVTLEKLKFAVFQRISEEFLDARIDISQHVNFFSNEIYMRMIAFVWAEEESAKYQKFKYPSDWWEAFKERWFTKTMLKKWPVKYKVTVFDVKAIYPTLKVKIPDHQRVLSIRRFDYDSTGN